MNWRLSGLSARDGIPSPRPGSIDPDMLDERASTLLNYADPRDLTLPTHAALTEPPPAPSSLRGCLL